MSSSSLRIRKAAVLGAGVMGAQIAAHLVNAGVDTVLFDGLRSSRRAFRLGYQPLRGDLLGQAGFKGFPPTTSLRW